MRKLGLAVEAFEFLKWCRDVKGLLPGKSNSEIVRMLRSSAVMWNGLALDAGDKHCLSLITIPAKDEGRLELVFFQSSEKSRNTVGGFYVE